MDVRDVQEKLYNITIMEGTNKAVFSKPMVAASLRADGADYNYANTHVSNAHAAARTAYAKAVVSRPDFKSKKINLIFPSEFKLSQKVFENGPTGTDGEAVSATHNLVAYKKNTGVADKNGVPVHQVHIRLCWVFVNLASVTELKLADDTSDDGLVADAFAGM